MIGTLLLALLVLVISVVTVKFDQVRNYILLNLASEKDRLKWAQEQQQQQQPTLPPPTAEVAGDGDGGRGRGSSSRGKAETSKNHTVAKTPSRHRQENVQSIRSRGGGSTDIDDRPEEDSGVDSREDEKKWRPHEVTLQIYNDMKSPSGKPAEVTISGRSHDPHNEIASFSVSRGSTATQRIWLNQPNFHIEVGSDSEHVVYRYSWIHGGRELPMAVERIFIALTYNTTPNTPQPDPRLQQAPLSAVGEQFAPRYEMALIQAFTDDRLSVTIRYVNSAAAQGVAEPSISVDFGSGVVTESIPIGTFLTARVPRSITQYPSGPDLMIMIRDSKGRVRSGYTMLTEFTKDKDFLADPDLAGLVVHIGCVESPVGSDSNFAVTYVGATRMKSI